MNSNEMAKITIAALDDKKAKDIKVIDISNVSVVADYFIIASGTNRNQVQAMADSVEKKILFCPIYNLPLLKTKYFLRSLLLIFSQPHGL